MTRCLSLWSTIMVIALFSLVATVDARAESRDGSQGPAVTSPQLAPGAISRYRIPYIHSEIGSVPRSATVVTVVNEAPVPCTVSVDWRKGFSATGPGGVICTTTFANLQRGQSADLCSRPLPGEITSCNAVCSPALTFDEGNAVVGSTAGPDCAKISVSARTYYFGASDTVVNAISDPAITKFAVGTVGD